MREDGTRIIAYVYGSPRLARPRSVFRASSSKLDLGPLWLHKVIGLEDLQGSFFGTMHYVNFPYQEDSMATWLIMYTCLTRVGEAFLIKRDPSCPASHVSVEITCKHVAATSESPQSADV